MNGVESQIKHAHTYSHFNAPVILIVSLPKSRIVSSCTSQMNSFKSKTNTKIELHDRYERKTTVNRAATNSQSLCPDKMEYLSLPRAYLSDTASGSLDLDSLSGSFEDLKAKPISLVVDDNRASATPHRRRLGRSSKQLSRSTSSLVSHCVTIYHAQYIISRLICHECSSISRLRT